MNTLYPLKFRPILKDKIWGGHKLQASFGKQAPELPNIGESWEISGVEGSESVVSNGFLEGNTLNELVETYMGDLVGDSVFERFGEQFPLLIKFIDAADDLSIQVHPDDEMAMDRHQSYGKTEMWYVMQADAGAKLISGFARSVTRDEYLKHLEHKTLNQILGYHEVTPGDIFFMPSGRVHAIGAGILLAEIQQSSDVTYRIYDFDRRDDQGNLRELHTELALDCIDFSELKDAKTVCQPQANRSVRAVECDYFTTNLLHLTMPVVKDYYPIDSFVIYVCVEGECFLQYGDAQTLGLCCGESVLVPASLNDVTLVPAPTAKLLEVYIDSERV
ncbi:mannose-6-phosphate isomerase [Breznakibacter xylanolyticus]|uniref:Phosphohexomutase n=1 Tax=Breznakibacter xylanolyticus TaxID=990 RepID=A0A2W7NKZ7_9BACT|nr:type I phosphomannose isomerase catalytic subunit [Breznakibacter xylanolyticus]PZX17344.1 mannose-6-phosphate isomerase [Breznakibacter xylanolyticus]